MGETIGRHSKLLSNFYNYINFIIAAIPKTNGKTYIFIDH